MKIINPTLHQIEAFVLACHLGSITAAAERMRLTQSAVSILLRQLERGLGTRLLDRTTRSLRPTAAGLEMLPRAERMLRDRDHLVSSVRAIRDVERGRLSFAATAAAASALMPAILAEFTRSHPEVEIMMQDVAPDQLVPKVLAEEVEFSIGTVNASSNELALETLVSDRLSAICRREHPIAARRSLSWEEAIAEPCISVVPGSGIRELIERTLTPRGKQFNPRWEVAFLTTALSMTAHGLGISILPGYLVPHLQYPALVAVPLRNPVVRRNLSAISRSGRSLSPAGRAFIDLIKRMSASTEADRSEAPERSRTAARARPRRR
ncbi:LysR family transcriptional regulator [Bradyrhizobium sp. STM 3562]|uniref:LysR family transcriptional regulator n=1 Tax=Bradyrhizobium sp. STM 3562 TaxID=578924 RepID=UPI00388D3312